MTFTKLNLHPKILQAIEACGYTQPTPVQSKAIPSILEGKDMVASAQTGTGKTAAYVLPGLQLLLTKKSIGKPRILILAPTRELAGQITKVIGKYGKFAKVNIASFVGGVSYHRQLRELSRPIDIIIATPGRLMDHMENRRLDLSRIEMLIIDEADRMLDMGFIDDIKTIVKATPESRQTLLFSATADDKLLSIMKNLLRNPIKINISQEKVDTNLIKQKIHIVTEPSHKSRLLEQLLGEDNIFKAIVFSATKRNAAKLATRLRDCGYAASPMHGDLKQSARNRTLAQFRTGEIQFLIATDVAARGIDVTDITHVINYDLPKFSEDYVHRIGRTGRAGKTGVAISIALKNEIHQIRKIERYVGGKIQMVQMTQHGEQEWQGPANESDTGTGRRHSKQRKHHSGQKAPHTKKFGDSPRYAKKSEGDSARPHTKKFGDSPHYAKKTEGSSARPHTRKFGDSPRYAKKSEGDSARPHTKKFGDSPHYAKKPEGNSAHPHTRKFGDSPHYAKKSEGDSTRPHTKKFGDSHRYAKKPEGTGTPSQRYHKKKSMYKQSKSRPNR